MRSSRFVAACGFLPTLLSLGIVVGSQSSNTLFPGETFAVGNRPADIFTIDLNGDGLPDLVVANRDDDDVSVLLARGDGTFEAQLRFATGDGPGGIAVSDFNGDLILDLAVANLNTDDVSVLLGHGDGSFAPATNFATGDGPFALASGDFDANLITDLITANVLAGTVSVLLGVGDGSFGAATDFEAGTSPWHVAVADVDGNGTDDVVTANSFSDDVSVLLGDGNGTFAPQMRFGTAAIPRGVAVADLNGDELSDLAVAALGADVVSILLGTGGGSFANQIPYAASTDPTRVAVADLNGDSIPDLVVGASNSMSVLIGQGAATFGPPVEYTTGDRPQVLAVEDFDGNGLLDVALANQAANDVSIFKGRGDGTFEVPTPFDAGDQPMGITVGEFDSEPLLDVAVANTMPGTVSILPGLGQEGLGQPEVYLVGTDPVAVATGDFDGNGLIDLVVANSGSNDLSILLGSGDGSFGSSTSVLIDLIPSQAIVDDFDGDLIEDLAVATLSFQSGVPSNVSVLLGLGNGSFGPPARYGAQSSSRSVVAGDFDGNGTRDLAVLNTNGTVSVVLGAGDGSFGAQTAFPTRGSRSIASGDLDNDGDVDLVTANFFSDDVSVLLGLGNGSFDPQTSYPAINQANEVRVADLNADGLPDLAVLGSGVGVAVLIGNGDGTFAPARRVMAPRPTRLDVGDMNADGRQDLVTSSNALAAVFVILNHGPYLLETAFGADTTLLTWRPYSPASSYNVYRGSLSDLQDDDEDGLPDDGWGVCRNAFDPDTTDTQHVDDEFLPTGDGFFYLVAFVDNDGEDGLGQSNAGNLRVPLTPCLAGDALVVSKFEDTADGSCDIDCSLREAIIAANVSPGRSDILLPPGTYTLSIPGTSEDRALTGDLDITSTLTITGSGAAVTIIDAGAIDRAFHLHEDSGFGINVTISAVTIQGGSSNLGGGVFNNHSGLLTIADSTLRSNTAGIGGAIFNSHIGKLNLTGTAVTGNVATGSGGAGILNAGVMALENTTISDNSATTIITNGGGGIDNIGSMMLTNVTISNNFTHSAFGVAGAGVKNSGTVTVVNTIISNNVTFMSITILDDNCFGVPLTSAGNNLERLDQCGLTGTGDLINTNPRLGSLGAHGGQTSTHSLDPDSPAIDAGTNSACPAVDQRGFPRPFDGDADGTAVCDIGAYELVDLGPCDDADEDGHGSPGNPACVGGGQEDCDDGDPTVYPGAPQVCDGVNNDCHALFWPDLTGTNEVDGDGDGFAMCDGDCDDLTTTTFPGGLELCDVADNDCDPATADGSDETWLGTDCDGADADLCEEGEYSCTTGTQTCSDTTGDSLEVCDGIDNDCDGQIDEDCVGESEPAVAICGDTAHYTWVRLEGENPNIFYRSCTIGGSCEPGMKLVGAATVEATPVVACQGETAIVMWEDYRNGNSDVAYRRSTDGGTSFGGLQFLVRGPSEEAEPALAMSGDVALAVWEDTRRGNKDLALRRSDDGGATWGPFTFLVRSPFEDTDPALDLSGTDGLLAWVDRRFGNRNIAYRRSADTATSWLNLTFLVKAASVEKDPTLVVDGTTIMIAWSDSRFGNEDLASRRSTNSGASFDGLKFLVRAPSDDSEPSIECGGLNCLLTWVDERSGNKNISFRHSSDGGATWGPTGRLVAAPTDEFGPACDLEDSLAACVWADTRTGQPKPHGRESLDGGMTWLPRFELDP